jgi:hypothetical protein
MTKVNLHIHTTYSDGFLTPVEVLKKLEDEGVKIASITDHDSVEAYYDLESKNISGIYSGIIIPGVEIKCIHNGYAIEILGYGKRIKELQPILGEYHKKIIESQQTQFKFLKEKCKELNLKIDDSELQPREWASFVMYGSLVKYKEYNLSILKKILGEDILKSRLVFYRKACCEKQSPFFLEEEILFSSKEVVEMIKNVGGLSFLAHVGQYKVIEDKIKFIQSLKENAGIDGVECYYPLHNEIDTKIYIDYCHDNGLLISGGSDFHGNGLQDVITQDNIYVEELQWIKKIKAL